MDSNKLRTFLEIVNYGSFTKAGKKLGYSQSGIVQMMNSLEDEVGFPLLIRSNRGISLSQEGEALLPLIEQYVLIDTRLSEECDQIKGFRTGQIRIGSTHAIACTFLPKAIKVFHEQHPDIRIEVEEESNLFVLEERLKKYEVNMIITSRQPHYSFRWIDLFEDPYYAVMPKDHPLAVKEVVETRDFVNDTYIMAKSSDGLDQDIFRYLKSLDISSRIGLTSNFDATVLTMVRDGLGVSLLPGLFFKTPITVPDDVEVRPVVPAFTRQIGIALQEKQNPSPASLRFISCIQKVAAQFAESY